MAEDLLGTNPVESVESAGAAGQGQDADTTSKDLASGVAYDPTYQAGASGDPDPGASPVPTETFENPVEEATQPTPGNVNDVTPGSGPSSGGPQVGEGGSGGDCAVLPPTEATLPESTQFVGSDPQGANQAPEPDLSGTPVVPVEEAPAAPDAVNDPPVDPDEITTIAEGQVATGNVLLGATDPNGDPLTVSDFTVVVDGQPLTVPAGGTITIPGVGSITIGSDGGYTFTPVENFNGDVPPITYTVSDGKGGTDTSTLTIDVTPVNDPPVDPDESKTIAEDQVATGNVLVGATDPEGDPLTVTDFTVVVGGQPTTVPAGGTITIPGVGTITIGGDGGYTFTPVENFNGDVPPITYTVSDGKGGTDTSTLTIDVTPVNDPPVATPNVNAVTEDVGVLVVGGNLFVG
jgi:CshA-type fibril repeat protein